MLHRHILRRAFAIWFAAFVAVLPDAAAVFEARAEAAAVSSPTQVHIEAEGIVDATFAHPGDCVVCHVLSALCTAPASPANPVAVRVAERPVDAPTASTSDARRNARRSRAPPPSV